MSGLTGAAQEVRERVGVLTIDPYREMQGRLAMSPPRLGDHGAGGDAHSGFDENFRKVRD